MFTQAVPKQRGIYSEILTTEDTQNLNVSLKNCLFFLIRKSQRLDPTKTTLLSLTKNRRCHAPKVSPPTV